MGDSGLINHLLKAKTGVDELTYKVTVKKKINSVFNIHSESKEDIKFDQNKMQYLPPWKASVTTKQIDKIVKKKINILQQGTVSLNRIVNVLIQSNTTNRTD